MTTFSPLCGNHVRKFVEEHMAHYFAKHTGDHFGYEDALIHTANEYADESDAFLELALRMNLPVTSAIAGALLNERAEAKRAYDAWVKAGQVLDEMW